MLVRLRLWSATDRVVWPDMPAMPGPNSQAHYSTQFKWHSHDMRCVRSIVVLRVLLPLLR
jgi:hypothetical protein